MGLKNYSHAIVRPPGASFEQALMSVPQPIDLALAQRQHAEYVSALEEAGVEVERLGSDDRFPDSCFMQDPAMLIREFAVLNRMAEPSRAGETDLIAPLLCERFECGRILAPGTIEGGDVLDVGETLIVGVSARTNVEGVSQLRALAGRLGMSVIATPVGEYLHLLTAVTHIGNNIVAVHEDFAGLDLLRGFNKVIVPRAEAYAANTLAIGEFVILPAGYPKTAEQIQALGLTVLPVPMSEFYKADGGVSCLSLIW